MNKCHTRQELMLEVSQLGIDQVAQSSEYWSSMSMICPSINVQPHLRTIFILMALRLINTAKFHPIKIFIVMSIFNRCKLIFRNIFNFIDNL